MAAEYGAGVAGLIDRGQVQQNFGKSTAFTKTAPHICIKLERLNIKFQKMQKIPKGGL